MSITKIKYIKITSKAVIFFCLLLTLTSFYSGYAYNKLKNPNSSTNIEAKDTLTTEKTKKPLFQFFVMSFCPFGNQMEEILRPVFDLIGDKAEIKPQYIFDKIEDLPAHCKTRSGNTNQCNTYIEQGYFKTIGECQETISQNYDGCLDESAYIKASNGTYYASLHGRIEANQNIREICAWNLADDKSKWWDFIDNVNKNCNAQNADTCWEEQAKKATLDTDKITQCFNNDAIDILEKEVALTQEHQIGGSPTLLLNNTIFPSDKATPRDGTGSLKIGKNVYKQNQYRSPNFIKEAICSVFKSAPSACKQKLEQPDPTNQPAATGSC